MLSNNTDYKQLFEKLKNEIQQSQSRAAFGVARELMILYWRIGQFIENASYSNNWGESLLDQLAHDLNKTFPAIEGLSKRNLYRMRKFFNVYPSEEHFVTQPVSQIPWGHNITIFQKLKTEKERLWYAQKTLEHGWSRPILEHQIDSKLIEREGKSLNNFTQTLPPIQSDLAKQILKDPYNFDFLNLTADAHERELERGLLENLKLFMLELGAGFSFVGSQYHMEVGDQDFYIDLLFYHLKLRAFIVIDLKTKAFIPEDAGKMQFYLGAVDDLLRHEHDAPSIGLILCKTKNKIIVEYTLKRNTSPIGVSEYLLTQALPDNLKSQLPSVAELETELERLETKLEERV